MLTLVHRMWPSFPRQLALESLYKLTKGSRLARESYNLCHGAYIHNVHVSSSSSSTEQEEESTHHPGAALEC